MAEEGTGLLGGSFDPVHLAHIALADAAHREASLAQVQLIPAANPWQRAPLKASAAHRLAMLRLAIGARPWLTINPVEITRGGKTYTLDTVRELPQAANYYWILGTDQLANFCSWRGWQEIAGRVHLLVARRPGTALEAPEPLTRLLARTGRALLELPFPAMPVSASHIRRQLARGAPTDQLLDPAVARYIAEHRLYQVPD